MTWQDWPARRRMLGTLRSAELGEAEAGSLVAAELAGFAERLHALAPEDFDHGLRSLIDDALLARPASAPLLTIANAVALATGRGSETVVAELRSVAERLRSSIDILAVMGAVFVPDGGAVLAHGTSSTVRRMLEVAAAEKHFGVTCGEGPYGAGRAFASELAEAGIRVEVVEDDLLVDTLFGVDLVITGAMALGPGSLVNTAGTATLVKEATGLDLRALLVAAADKALPGPLFDRVASAAAGMPDLEVVPLAGFESIVTELGVLDPEAASRLAAQREVAPDLS